MRRFAPQASRSSSIGRLTVGAVIAVAAAFVTIQAQIPGRNVNMVSGTTWPEGDPYLQRQNEPSAAASTRNPLHLLGGSNDYRTVDVPGLPDGEETGDAWLGLFKSVDGGQRWTSTLLPGYPQDQSPAGLASPLKAYQAGADAVVRAGTSGLLYYSGLVFDRAENGKSGVFLARFIDNNNQEAGDPIAYLGTKLVASSNGARFLDKPWMAVDIPRNNAATCTVTSDSIIATAQNGRRRRHGFDRHEWGYTNNRDRNSRGRGGRPAPPPPPSPVQRIPAGAVYVAYSSITGDAETLRSEILLTRSMDCGNTWSAPIKVSRPEDAVNQGSSITIDPRTGAVYVGWRRFDPNLTDATDLDAIMVARLPFSASRFDTARPAHNFRKPERKVGRKLHRLFEHRANRFTDVPSAEATENLDQFDLGTTGFNFRTNAYPTMATDGTGRVYLAWTQRGFQADSSPTDGARIVVATTRDGRTFSAPRPVDDHSTPGRGHQLMPSMAFAGGKLMLVFYDLRDSKAQTFNRIASDFNTLSGLRQTIDIRSAMALPADVPDFEPSVKVSDYVMGFNPESGEVEELQVNPPNLPMFKQGTVPFMGDYIDVTAAPAFVRTGNKWAYNTASGGQMPMFHAVWTDNRDVRPPRNGEWWNYTPARMSPGQPPSNSIFDPTQPVPQCVDGSGNPGSRNQNVYSARITGGLLAGSPGNAKPLSTDLQRAFVVFAQNTSTETTSFRMTILNQPTGGRASFEQFPAPPFTGPPPPPETAIEMIVPPRSTASRTVYATSTDPNASIQVAVSELIDLRTLASPALYPAAPEKPGGLETVVVINPDIENPDIENPDIENPDIENPDIENSEVYNPDIENPDIENPDIENPDIENPDIENPDIENPDIENPDIENVRVANPDIENPDIENPDIENPDIENPDIENPDIENGAIADITWKVTNDGNTTAAFNVNLFLSQQQLPASVRTQLILLKTYRTPVTVANGCQLGFQTRNILLANIRNPILVPPGGGIANANDPAETNATLWLAPGEEGRIVLRVIDDDTSNNVPITKPNGDIVYVDPALVPGEGVSPGVQPQAVDGDDADAGLTDPPLVTPSGSNLFFLQMPSTASPGRAITPSVRVQVRSLTGVPIAGATVTLSLGSPVADATLSGNIAVTGVDGIATFPALTVNAAGSGLTLTATAAIPGSVATGVSAPFDITTSTVVNNTADSGPGSLRAAIVAANARPGGATITFNIVGTAAPVIALQTPLPALSSFTIIDGRTQPGYDNSPVVELTWAGGDVEANGLTIGFDQTGVQILGLAITRFPAFGIQSLQADSPGGGGHQVRFNTIGTDRFSTAGKGNQSGIEMRTDDGVIELNVISGNHGTGVLVMNDADRVLITGNRIGTSGDGLSALPNNTGITIYDSPNDTDILANLISGNAEYGIDIQDSEAGDVTGTRIRANRIGLNGDGSELGNGDGGVRIENGPGTIIGTPGTGGNIISANRNFGIAVHGARSTGVVIQGNRIGTDPTGSLPLGNSGPGIQVTTAGVDIGWRNGDPASPAAGNLISGNAGDGIQLLGASASGNRVRGNWIGTNLAGTAALGSGAPTDPFSNYQAIYVTGPRNIIGGQETEARNLLSGNRIDGVYLDGAAATDNVIVGNFIGTDTGGTAAVANGFEGVGLIGAPGNTVTGNLVSGNARYGLYVFGDGNTIAGNTVGAADGGNAPLGNQAGGIYIVANNTRVGVASPNVIAFNTGNGVTVVSGTGNEIANNSIQANTLMGIDLAANSVTLNDQGDGDIGANTLQNFPVLANARNPVASNTMVDFDTSSFSTGLYTLRFFAGACDQNGYGEGARQVGLINSLLNGAAGSITLTEVVPNGEAITATATDAAGNTSEFSACTVVSAPASPATITSVSPNPSAPGFGQLLYIRGTNLPGVNPSDVILTFNAGENIAQHIWHISPTLVVARFYLGTPVGPATIRVKSPDGLTVSNSFPVALEATPGAPIMTAVSAGCGGSGFLSTVTAGDTIYVSAEGIDTTGATVVFTPIDPAGPPIEVPVVSTCGSGNGSMSAQVTVPGLRSPTTVNVQIKTQVGGTLAQFSRLSAQAPTTSALSNPHPLIVNTP